MLPAEHGRSFVATTPSRVVAAIPREGITGQEACWASPSSGECKFIINSNQTLGYFLTHCLTRMLPLKPYAESTPNRYCRLFSPAGDRPVPGTPTHQAWELALTTLVARMSDDGTRVSKRPRGQRPPEVLLDPGYTYFGQFVDHDLTKDPATLEEAWQREPGELENLHTPFLDLAQLYGRGPADPSSADLYETDGVRLRVGDAVNGWSFDLAMRPGLTAGEPSWPRLADDRSSENVILRQIVAVFARLHNAAAEGVDPALPASDRFALARRQTVWTYQYLVCHDYLATVLDPDVYREVFALGQTIFEWSSTFSIPVEFSVAAMRFGHSMVRASYFFNHNPDGDFSLTDIMRRGQSPGALTAEWMIAWDRFFQGAGPGPILTPARPIDTRLTPALFHLSPTTIHLFSQSGAGNGSAQPISELALRTLRRGTGLRLIDGQSAARQLNLPVLSDAQLIQDDAGTETAQGEVIRGAAQELGFDGLWRQTPLWYYLLKESEVVHNGNHLGPAGSRIVAGTIASAMRHDPDSYWNAQGVNAQPPVWRNLEGVAPTSFQRLGELFAVASALR